MGRLREQMKGDLELRGLSWKTQEIYLSQVRDFSRHFNRSPLHLGERGIKEYLLYLIREKRASTIAELQDPAQFSALLKDLYCREWVVYAKPPFKDPEMLLCYLGRYTNRIAIGNHRIIKMQDGKVSFLKNILLTLLYCTP